MPEPGKYIVGTAGYSFKDWVGPFYPEGTKASDMFRLYVRQFSMVELNFTFYAMPFPRTLQSLADASPAGFEFWVKANQEITHKGNLQPCQEFMENLDPLRQADKLAGVLLQFPQSFHRTEESRRYLAAALEKMRSAALAVEFRHNSWEHPATTEGLAQRNVTLVVPDVPEIAGLYRHGPAATTRTGYLRLHSRGRGKWYKGMEERYDYHYSRQEMADVIADWAPLQRQLDKTYVVFNNCHAGHAGQNALEFKQLAEELSR